MFRRILIVEDNEPFRELLAAVLAARRFDVIVASTGAEALHAAALRGVDAVIADVELPDASGIDVCRVLHRQPFARAIPVWLMSGSHEPAVADAALAAGAMELWHKPFSVENACRQIAAYWDGRPAEDTPARTAAESLLTS